MPLLKLLYLIYLYHFLNMEYLDIKVTNNNKKWLGRDFQQLLEYLLVNYIQLFPPGEEHWPEHALSCPPTPPVHSSDTVWVDCVTIRIVPPLVFSPGRSSGFCLDPDQQGNITPACYRQ